MKKITFSLILTSLIVSAGSLGLQQEHYDFNGKFSDEKAITLTLEEKRGDLAVIGSIADISRFGLSDQQYGVEVYSNIGPKEWFSYGYVAGYISPSSSFLPRTDLSAGIYKGVGRGVEFGAGYKRMNFTNSSIDIFRTSASAPLPVFSSISILETATFVPANQTASLESKIIFDNENNLKVFYSYSFGDSAENLGFAGIVKKDRTVHSVGLTYRINANSKIGASLTREDYESFYLKEGGSIFVSYTW